jgi:hypothetical protein
MQPIRPIESLYTKERATLRDLDGVAINRAFAETADEAIEIVWQVWKSKSLYTKDRK